MNIDKMVKKIVKAQEAINEPMIIIRKTEVDDEIHNVFLGSGSELMVLQACLTASLFKSISADITLNQATALKKVFLAKTESNIDAILKKMTTNKE